MLLVVISDAPSLPSGLARIARDLIEHLLEDPILVANQARLVQIGIRYDDSPQPWKVYHADTDSYGANKIVQVIQWEAEPGERVVVFTVQDLGRCYGTLNELATINQQYQIRTAGYFPIDSANFQGKIGGPAAEVLSRYDFVLAYGKYGHGIIKATTGRSDIKWLPHGIDNRIFNLAAINQAEVEVDPFKDGIHEWLGSSLLVSTVGTNQPRKDWGTTFAAFKLLADDYKYHLTGIKFWIHVDQLSTEAWSIPELATLYSLNNDKLLVTTYLDDSQLAFLYGLSNTTFANGLGEGFGYPIVESLACGTPVVHTNFAGGTELIPRESWKVAWSGTRQEGPYATERPLLDPHRVKQALDTTIEFSETDPTLAAAYCNGAVQHLFWPNLWERWRSWFSLILKD